MLCYVMFVQSKKIIMRYNQKQTHEIYILIIFFISLISSCQKEKSVQSSSSDANRPLIVESGNTWENQIGEIVNDQMVFTVDEDILIENINKNLKDLSNIDLNTTNLELITIADKYYVRAYGPQYSSSILIHRNGNGLYPSDPGMIMNNITCTTTDCSSDRNGCYPDTYTSCKPCTKSDDECTKTISSMSLLVNFATGAVE